MILHRRGVVAGLVGAVAALGALPVRSQNAGPAGRIAQSRSQEPAFTNTIGLIGGLAHRAGIFYYEQILQRYNAHKKPLKLVLSHADVTKVLASIGANDKAELGNYLGTLANELFDAGANLVAVTAVAPHLAIKEISHVARGPVVNVLDSIAAGLEAAGMDRVAVFGNRAVMETNVFGAIREDMVVKLDRSVIEDIHTLYGNIALHGKRGTQPEVQHLSKVARMLIDKGGAKAIVLAGTDLSSFYAEHQPDYPFVDMAQLHIDQIMRVS